jgi:replicative DNA helicase
MEQAYQDGRVGSAFEQAVPLHTLRWAETALELSLSAGQEVVLFTRSVAAESLVAGLAFHRAGVDIEKVYRGDLDDDGFDRLTSCLARMKGAKLLFQDGLPRTPESVAGHVVDGRFVLVC